MVVPITESVRPDRWHSMLSRRCGPVVVPLRPLSDRMHHWPARPNSTPMKHILIIEDDPDTRDNIEEILTLADYSVTQAANGRDGVTKARELHPDLILCDITMPELDGYGVLHMMSRHPSTADIPFIFISGKSEHGEVRMGMELGADDYLVKPFRQSELLKAIEGRFRRKEVMDRPYSGDARGLFDFMEDAASIESLKNLGRERRLRSVPARTVLFNEGDELKYVYFVDEGSVRTFKTTTGGKELVTGLHAKGDIVGYMTALTGEPSSEVAETVETSQLAWIPVKDLVDLLCKDHDVALRFIKLLSHNVREKEFQLLSLAYGSVRQRLAQTLARLRDRQTEKTGDEIMIGREDLANMVGTATESVVRSLSDLKAEGIIDVKGRGIHIRDAKALRRVALM